MVSIEINPETTFQHIQKLFSTEFPLLKLQFFQVPASTNAANYRKDLIENSHEKVGSHTTIAMDKIFAIHPNMLVGDFEKLFEEKLHLHVQVFYKAGNHWLESIQSDPNSLRQLNEMAKERNEKIPEQNEPQDYHEQE